MADTCYMCEAPATSQEHAPPQCLFPEMASIGRDLRKNLITVPSCDAHNSKKSEDDEFLRAILCLPAAGISAAATHHFNSKVLRGAQRSRERYRSFAPRASVLTPPGKSAFKADRDRLNRCIEHIVKAIYFHTYGVKWSLPVAVASPLLQAKSASGQLVAPVPYLAFIEATRAFLSNEHIKGENQEIFLYRIKIEEDTLAFAGLFYEHIEIFAVSSPEIPGNGT